MKIAITLDDVIRAKSKSILKAYKKEHEDFDIESVKLDTKDFETILGFKNSSEYQQFLYYDYAFEIFGEADVTEKMIDKKINLWLIDINNRDNSEEQPVEMILTNAFEFNTSIGFTHFFLSKIATRIRETFFPLNSLDIYEKCDILITAEPNLLNNKPEGKIVIKIETDYNKDLESDYTYKTLSDFLDDNEIISKLHTQIYG